MLAAYSSTTQWHVTRHETQNDGTEILNYKLLKCIILSSTQSIHDEDIRPPTHEDIWTYKVFICSSPWRTRPPTHKDIWTYKVLICSSPWWRTHPPTYEDIWTYKVLHLQQSMVKDASSNIWGYMDLQGPSSAKCCFWRQLKHSEHLKEKRL